MHLIVTVIGSRGHGRGAYCLGSEHDASEENLRNPGPEFPQVFGPFQGGAACVCRSLA